MATYTINNDWEILGGLRLTQTDTEVNGYIYLADEDRVTPSHAKMITYRCYLHYMLLITATSKPTTA